MDSEKDKKEKEKRKNLNEDIIKRLRMGDPLQGQSHLTWFPPRPVIKKDEKHIQELYGKDTKMVGTTESPKLVCIQTNNKEGDMDDGNKTESDGTRES